MPLFFEEETVHDGIIGIWKIREDEEYFLDRIELSSTELMTLASIKGKGRRVEWLAVRHLLHHLTGNSKRQPVLKDQYGKPFIPNSDFHISISHSHEMAAVLASPILCGVDIQYPVEKIRRLGPKFCSNKELKETEMPDGLRTMHIIWGAKECMYKAYGKKEIDYRKHLQVDTPSRLLSMPGKGRLKKKNTHIKYEIRAELVLDYILTYCFETEVK